MFIDGSFSWALCSSLVNHQEDKDIINYYEGERINNDITNASLL